MNERIKEFAEQVEKWIRTTNFEGMPEDEMTYDEIFQKKFAELIVRECLDKVAEAAHARRDPFFAYSQILEHFGVEDTDSVPTKNRPKR